jgi:hypothetical protein
MRLVIFFIYCSPFFCNPLNYADNFLKTLFAKGIVKNFDHDKIYLHEDSLSLNDDNINICYLDQILLQAQYLNIDDAGFYLKYIDLLGLKSCNSLQFSGLQLCSKKSNSLSEKSNREIFDQSSQSYNEAMMHYKEAREHLLDAVIHAGGAAASFEFCLPLSGLEIYKSVESIKKMCDEFLKGYEIEHGDSESSHFSRSDWIDHPSNFQPDYQTDTLKLHD